VLLLIPLNPAGRVLRVVATSGVQLVAQVVEARGEVLNLLALLVQLAQQYKN